MRWTWLAGQITIFPESRPPEAGQITRESRLHVACCIFSLCANEFSGNRETCQMIDRVAFRRVCRHSQNLQKSNETARNFVNESTKHAKDFWLGQFLGSARPRSTSRNARNCTGSVLSCCRTHSREFLVFGNIWESKFGILNDWESSEYFQKSQKSV